MDEAEILQKKWLILKFYTQSFFSRVSRRGMPYPIVNPLGSIHYISKISVPSLYWCSGYELPRISKSRRHLLYQYFLPIFLKAARNLRRLEAEWREGICARANHVAVLPGGNPGWNPGWSTGWSPRWADNPLEISLYSVQLYGRLLVALKNINLKYF